MRSIRHALLKQLLLPLVALNLVVAAATWWLAWAPTQRAFDEALADAAWSLLPYIDARDGRIAVHLSRQAEQILRLDHFDAIYFVVRNEQGHTIEGDADFPTLVKPARPNEPHAYDGAMRGNAVRIITLSTPVGQETVTIGVAETLWKRVSMRSGPGFIGLLLLDAAATVISVLIAWTAVLRGLSPLNAMRRGLDTRGHDDLAPLQHRNLPEELQPLADALNALLERVRLAAQGQQDFLANAAHQLRTPLAGLKTQLEWLEQRHAADDETAQSTALMMSAIERMIRQTNQLLALARAEPSQFQRARLYPLALDKLVEQSVQHFVREAMKKRIDLGFELQPAMIAGDSFLLRDLIDNLIDNAIRYCPPDGRVTVSCGADDGGVLLSVEDSGPGIPEAERELIFSRFYRLNDKIGGSGLGLSIVRDIALDHGAELQVQPGADGKGTVFSVRFPRA
ncbi:sensor histidine kinase [Noviherbaspirillum pedocola]|uniref:histidine kinase n=1 Tax=Noviherbaspirillum pedocola TaxID=2801341 RepID=A0A934SX60_9BURK|nr:sensor histidine kinase [Noviherbaspirillum pedocola]MBK4733433.1 sensor histidine kinase [Noviherbaspirillum pedocola]